MSIGIVDVIVLTSCCVIMSKSTRRIAAAIVAQDIPRRSKGRRGRIDTRQVEARRVEARATTLSQSGIIGLATSRDQR